MANGVYHGGRYIILDTFSSDINLNTLLGGAGPLFIGSIEWQTPTTADHTAIITDDSGIPIFSETCVTAKQSIVKYYHGLKVDNLKVASSGVGSGKIVLILANSESDS